MKALPGKRWEKRALLAAAVWSQGAWATNGFQTVALAQQRVLPEEAPLPGEEVREAPAPVKPPALPPPRSRSWVLETTLSWPFQFMGTSNKQGNATSYSLVGYGLDLALCLTPVSCSAAKVTTNLNPGSGSKLLSGVSLGGRFFGIGRADPVPDPSDGNRAASRLQAIWRVWGTGSLCQKDYDFSSLYGQDNDQVFIGTRPELEGSFWCVEGEVGTDYLTKGGHRLGLALTYFRSLKGSQEGLRVTGLALEMRYQILRF